MTEQPSDRCYPQIFGIPFFQRVNSGDKGEAYAYDAAFFQKAFSSASSGYFCPLRSRVNVYFDLYRMTVTHCYNAKKNNLS